MNQQQRCAPTHRLCTALDARAPLAAPRLRPRPRAARLQPRLRAARVCARAGRAEQFLHQRQQRIEDGESSNPMVVRVSSSNSDLYLIGTRHEDPRSANIVRSIIGIVKPHATAIEQRGGTSYLKGVRADNNEFAVATQLGSKHGRVVPIDIAVFDALAGVERTTPRVQLVEARIGHTIDVMCLETFCFEHPRLKQTSETRIYMEERDETMAAALRPFVYSEPREGGTGRCVAVVGRAHIVGIVNKLLSEPKPIANPSTDDVYTDNLDVRRSLFDTMYGGAVGGTLNRKDGPFGYVEKSEAATEFFEMALRGEAIFRAWLPLISADAITNETLSIVARRLLDAFEAGHDPFYTMVTASREVLELNASGAVSHSSSWLRRMFNVGPKLHIDHESWADKPRRRGAGPPDGNPLSAAEARRHQGCDTHQHRTSLQGERVRRPHSVGAGRDGPERRRAGIEVDVSLAIQ